MSKILVRSQSLLLMKSRNKAIDFIKSLVAKPEMGKIYKGKVVKIMEFGAFVNFFRKTRMDLFIYLNLQIKESQRWATL